MAKQSILKLRVELISARELANTSANIDDTVRANAKQQVRKLQSRIANRERYAAMRSLGLVKTPYGWE